MVHFILKTLLVFAVSALAHVSPAMAAIKKGMDSAVRYYDDITPDPNLLEFKKKRDEQLQKIRQEIYAARPVLQKDRSELAKKVVDRKVRLVRERDFLDAEFYKGLNALYAKGVFLFAQKDFAASRMEFEEIERLSPDFKETRDYLKKIESTTQDNQGGKK